MRKNTRPRAPLALAIITGAALAGCAGHKSNDIGGASFSKPGAPLLGDNQPTTPTAAKTSSNFVVSKTSTATPQAPSGPGVAHRVSDAATAATGPLTMAPVLPSIAAPTTSSSLQITSTGASPTEPQGAILPPVVTAPDPAPNQALCVDALLGYVNGDPLFVGDILSPIAADLRRSAGQNAQLVDFRNSAKDAVMAQMRNHISEMLIMNAANSSLTNDDQKRLDVYVAKERMDLLNKHGGSEAMAERDLRAQGGSVRQYLADKRREAVRDFYLHRLFFPKIVVTQRDCREYYAHNIDKYSTPAEVDLYTITLAVADELPKVENPTGSGTIPKPDPTAEELKAAAEKTVKHAREIIADIKSGKDFAEMAQTYSVDDRRNDGGHRPHLHRGVLVNEKLEGLAFKLAPNTIAEPLAVHQDSDPTNDTVIIVKVEDTLPAKVTPFANVQDQIERKLREQQFADLSKKWYVKIFDQSSIEAVEQMADTATDVAVAKFWER